MADVALNVVATDDLRAQTVLFNTFFYEQLSNRNGFSNQRILKIFSKLNFSQKTRYLIIPINLKAQNHWSLSIIVLNNTKDRGPLSKGSNILYLDSMYVAPENVYENLSRAVALAETFVQLRASSSSSLDRASIPDINLDSDDMMRDYPFLGTRLNLPKQ
jgi:Ulp1 family protease